MMKWQLMTSCKELALNTPEKISSISNFGIQVKVGLEWISQLPTITLPCTQASFPSIQNNLNKSIFFWILALLSLSWCFTLQNRYFLDVYWQCINKEKTRNVGR